MPPIKLTDAEMDAVLQAARPLDVAVRDAFLQSVANALARRMVGPGIVHQVCRDLQREFFDPPDLSRGNMARQGKYR